LLREGGGLEDRDGDRAGQPLRFLSRVDREGLEARLTAGRRLRWHAREYRLVEFDARALVALTRDQMRAPTTQLETLDLDAVPALGHRRRSHRPRVGRTAVDADAGEAQDAGHEEAREVRGERT